MKQIFGMIVVLLLVSAPLFAQNYSKAEVFGGYQYTRVSPGGGVSGENFNGWNAALTGNMNHWLGFTGDVSGAYKSISGVSLKQYTFLFGPTVAFRGSDKFTPFVHGLFGVAHDSASLTGVGSGSNNAFAAALGGGVDVGSKHLAFRVGQFDLLLTRFGGATQKDFRYSAGIVFRF